MPPSFCHCLPRPPSFSWVISLSYVCPSLCVCVLPSFVSDSFSREIRNAYLVPLFQSSTVPACSINSTSTRLHPDRCQGPRRKICSRASCSPTTLTSFKHWNLFSVPPEQNPEDRMLVWVPQSCGILYFQSCVQRLQQTTALLHHIILPAGFSAATIATRSFGQTHQRCWARDHFDLYQSDDLTTLTSVHSQHRVNPNPNPGNKDERDYRWLEPPSKCSESLQTFPF